MPFPRWGFSFGKRTDQIKVQWQNGAEPNTNRCLNWGTRLKQPIVEQSAAGIPHQTAVVELKNSVLLPTDWHLTPLLEVPQRHGETTDVTVWRCRKEQIAVDRNHATLGKRPAGS